MTVRAPRHPARMTLLASALVPSAAIVAYAASPYVALYNLGQALRTHDLHALQKAVDWDRVRAGIKQEIEASLAADGASPARAVGSAVSPPAMTVKAVTKVAAPAAAADDLPDFGDSFATSAVSQSVDDGCTPAALSAMIGGATPSSRSRLGMFAEARRAISWAFFTGPSRFVAMVHPGDGSGEPVRVSMAFSRRAGWRVTKVWLPPGMLEQRPATRT